MTVPQYFFDEFVELYPDAKFILTERDVDSWITSMSTTIFAIMKSARAFPLNTLRWFDPWIRAFCTLHLTFEDIILHGKGVDAGVEHMRSDYLDRYVVDP